jgi:alkylated DNA repair dioxygenase AlkB
MIDDLGLFDEAGTFEAIPLPDAELQFMRNFYDHTIAAELRNALREEIAWRQETIFLAGEERLQPRLSAWYGDTGSSYTYSGITLEPLPWTAALLRIKEDIEQATGHRFNSVLLNLYRNEHDSVSWHSDDEAVLGERPVIASLSLGETRAFKFRHKTRKDRKPVSIALTDGSLLIMAGTTQRYWRHAIDKEREPKRERINLTFRQVLRAG